MAQQNANAVPWNELAFLADAYDTTRLAYFEEDLEYRERNAAICALQAEPPFVWPNERRSLCRAFRTAVGRARAEILEKLSKERVLYARRERMREAYRRSEKLQESCNVIKKEMLGKMGRCPGARRPRKIVRASDVSLIRKYKEWKSIDVEISGYGQLVNRELEIIEAAAAAHGVTLPPRKQNPQN